MDQKRKEKNEVTVCLVWRWKPNENVTEANSLKASQLLLYYILLYNILFGHTILEISKIMKN